MRNVQTENPNSQNVEHHCENYEEIARKSENLKSEAKKARNSHHDGMAKDDEKTVSNISLDQLLSSAHNRCFGPV